MRRTTRGSRLRVPRWVEYEALAKFRYALRRFLRLSEDAAREEGISPGQYQLLLFVRGLSRTPPTVAELADRLQVRHQSAVGLIDRCAWAGLVRRLRDSQDRRRVRVALTPRGRATLARLVARHVRGIDELKRAVPRLPARNVRPDLK